MRKLKLIFSISVISIFLIILTDATAVSLNLLGGSEEPIMVATGELPETICKGNICYSKHQVDVSGLNGESKAELLTKGESGEIYIGKENYIEHNGEIVKVLDGVRIINHRIPILGITWRRHYEVKVERKDGTIDWYNVNNWEGVYYKRDHAIWPNLKDDELTDPYTAWNERAGVYENFYKAWDKTPHTFAERQLSEPIKVSDLPGYPEDEGYYHYVHQWVEKADEEEKEQVGLTDEKLALIWREAARINIDPFYFLAILAAEGTGSFDTFGEPQEDFETDLVNAANLIDREINRWKEAGEPGDWLQWVNVGNADHINSDDEFIGAPQYFSGYDEEGNIIGGYAKDPHWWENVRNIYNGLRLQSP